MCRYTGGTVDYNRRRSFPFTRMSTSVYIARTKQYCACDINNADPQNNGLKYWGRGEVTPHLASVNLTVCKTSLVVEIAHYNINLAVSFRFIELSIFSFRAVTAYQPPTSDSKLDII